MCQTLPGRIIALDPPLATVEIDGVQYTVNTQLIKEPLAVGDHLLTNAGHATAKVDAQTAEEIMALNRSMKQMQETS